MDNYIKTWLFDILNSINEIDSYFEGPKLFLDYQNDLRTKRAVERNLEIIGEAMNRIEKIDSTINISSKKQIISMRNRVIHGYDKIDNEIIWGTIVRHLPNLKTEIEGLLK